MASVRLSRCGLAAALLAVSLAISAAGRLEYKWNYYAPAGILFTPTVGGDGCVYMATDDSLIRAVSPSGQTLWAVDPGGRPSAAMALQGSLLYFPTSQGELAAYGVDGHLAWRTPLGSQLCSTPAVAADGRVYATTVSGRVYCLGPNGAKLWSFNTGDPIVTSPVIGHSGRIFVASTRNLYALSRGGIPLAITRLHKMVISPLALDADDNLYFVDAAGAAWSRKPGGRKRWHSEGSETLIATSAPPVISRGAVVLSASFSTPPAPKYTISGAVTLTDGTSPLQNVVISAGTTPATTATTDATGKYTLAGMADGTYTLTPTLAGYGFNPSTMSVTVSGANVTGKNFTARGPGYSISGTILAGGAGLPGVTVSEATFGSTTLTSASGTYTLDGLPNGTYSVKPTLDTYTFDPTSQTVVVFGASVGAVDFTATKTAAFAEESDRAEDSADTYSVGAYDLSSGAQAWTPLDKGSHFGPALSADGTLFVPSTGDTMVYLLDRDAGTTLGTLSLSGAPGDMVLADTARGPRLYFVSGARLLLCYGTLTGPDPAAPWSQIGGGPRHLYRPGDSSGTAPSDPEEAPPSDGLDPVLQDR